jgi:hypothetical protein
MRSATLFLLAAIIVACPGPSSHAQYGWPYGGYYASTAGEGYAMGMAAMVQSAGMATLMTSKAAVNAQEAGSLYIDNTVKATQAYIDRQRMLGSYQASLRKPPPTAEQLYRMSQMGLPKTLSARQLDPVTGAISWPVVLRDEPFDTYRETAQKFFQEAVANPQSFSYDSYNQFQQAGSECLADLKSRIKDYRPNDYIEAKKFVESLTYAAQQL